MEEQCKNYGLYVALICFQFRFNACFALFRIGKMHLKQIFSRKLSIFIIHAGTIQFKHFRIKCFYAFEILAKKSFIFSEKASQNLL